MERIFKKFIVMMCLFSIAGCFSSNISEDVCSRDLSPLDEELSFLPVALNRLNEVAAVKLNYLTEFSYFLNDGVYLIIGGHFSFKSNELEEVFVMVNEDPEFDSTDAFNKSWERAEVYLVRYGLVEYETTFPPELLDLLGDDAVFRSAIGGEPVGPGIYQHRRYIDHASELIGLPEEVRKTVLINFEESPPFWFKGVGVRSAH